MGKLTALILIVVTAVWLGPMCARLPAPETMGAVAVTAPLAAAIDPIPAPAPAPAPAPVATAKPAPEGPAVVVSNYRSRKMFAIADGNVKISVLLTNKSDREAKDLRLTLSVAPANLPAENARVNYPFAIAASSAVYRGLTISSIALDALLGDAAGKSSEMRWDLTYRLDGDEAGTKRCFTLRSLPRQHEPEGVEWKKLETSTDCPAKK
ncbi:MAG: hypothetical protein HY923_03945 [Elusimicrobia bacterium]|nr:hypothetical protein [Elusimicrobiota bacterium]